MKKKNSQDVKNTGSFYTPENVVRFMVDFLAGQERAYEHVLEPAAGDGRFLPVLLDRLQCSSIDVVEVFEEKIRDMRSQYDDPRLHYYYADFLDYAVSTDVKYDLIIGNPPYVSIKSMADDEIEKARELFFSIKLDRTVMQNLWAAFVVGATQLLTKTGALFFVLPAEFLQVHFAEKLRLYLEQRFNNIKIFTFDENIFPEIEQQTCLVYLSNSEKAPPYTDYYVYSSPESASYQKINRIEKSKPLKKWSNAVLDDGEIQLLQTYARQFPVVDSFGICAPGIVTGGNRYFIVKPSFVKKAGAEDYVLPIIQKNSILKDSTIIINDALFRHLKNDDVPVYLLNFQGKENIPNILQTYLEEIGKQEVGGTPLKEHHKCSKREPWYAVPIVHSGDVVFFKRSDKLPRLYINEEHIHTTDAGYHIRTNDKYDAASIVFCFYNSLTLALCEFNGRYYGGGVLELTPSEFKSLSVPYTRIAKEDVCTLDAMFRERCPVVDIVSFVNERVLRGQIAAEDIKRLNKIRDKLMARRLK